MKLPTLKILQEYDGDLNFGFDAWTSPNSRALLGVTVHYEENGKAIAYLLDIVEVPHSHTGVALAAAFKRVLAQFGISDKVSFAIAHNRTVTEILTGHQILSVTCDNASANDSMVDELQVILPDFPGEASRTRCFCHIINLVVKSVIKQFDAPKAKKTQARRGTNLVIDNQDARDHASKRLEELAGDIEDDEAEQQVEERQVNSEEDNLDGWVDERAEMADVEIEYLDREVLPARLVLTKVGPCLFHPYYCP